MHVPLIVQGLLVVLLLSAPYFGKRILLGYSKGLFSCTRCGSCCRDVTVPLTQEDVKRIEGAGFQRFCAGTWIGTKIMLMPGLTCFFYGDRGCRIYSIRPQICKEFPFMKIFGLIPYARTWHYCRGMQEIRKIIE